MKLQRNSVLTIWINRNHYFFIFFLAKDQFNQNQIRSKVCVKNLYFPI